MRLFIRLLIPTFLIALMSINPLNAQDDLMDLLEDNEEPQQFAYATFKTVRIVNGHSVEMAAPGVLQMMIAHRFGRLNSGLSDLFGLDQANMRFGFEYGIAPGLNLGIGRSNIGKTYDASVKWRIFRQKSGPSNFPFTVVAYTSAAMTGVPNDDPDRELSFNNRLSYTSQLLIARKFSNSFSLQLSPTFLHRNLVSTAVENNDVFSMGIGGRLKINNSLAINAEYYLLTGDIADRFEDSFSIGLDIETGGHVFQLVFSNSVAMSDPLYIAQTRELWGDGDIHFGFNLARVFNVKKNR